MKTAALSALLFGSASAQHVEDLGMCDPRTCADWKCSTWCDCFENPLVAAMFEKGSEHYEELSALCPIDDDLPCECGTSDAFLEAQKEKELPPLDGAIRAQNNAPILEGVEFIAEVAYNGEWYEICGPWAWDDQWTATAACKNVGYMVGKQHKTRHILENYGMRVGKCTAGDDSVKDCTRGGNAYGDLTLNMCTAGKPMGMTMTCTKKIETMHAKGVTDGAIRAYGNEEIVEDEWFYPEVAFNERWFPVCGHYAWDDYWTATTMCKSLGYLNGLQEKTKEKLWTYSMRVGKCHPWDDDYTKCTRAGNSFGDLELTQCNAGKHGGMRIKCSNHMSIMDATGVHDGAIRGHQGAAVVDNEWFKPEVAYDGKWYPMCGIFAWDDKWTATAACKSLGYKEGEQKQSRDKLWTWGMLVGKCREGANDVTDCSIPNKAVFGDLNNQRCHAGRNMGFQIKCTGLLEETTTTESPTNSPTDSPTKTPLEGPLHRWDRTMCGKFDGKAVNQENCEEQGCMWKTLSPTNPWDHGYYDPACYNDLTDKCAVNGDARRDCTAAHGKLHGNFDQKRDQCEAVGCCWQPTKHGQNRPWCFKSQDQLEEGPEHRWDRTMCGRFDGKAVNEENCKEQGCLWKTLSPTNPWDNGYYDPACYNNFKNKCAVNGDARRDCTAAHGKLHGNFDQKRDQCEAVGCCWQPTKHGHHRPWCFQSY